MTLCGGTLLTLLSAVKRKTREQFSFLGLNGTVNDPMMLAAFLKMVSPDFPVSLSGSSFRSVTSRYKNCRYNYGADIPLNEKRFTQTFHTQVCEQYPAVLGQMDIFCRLFLPVEEEDKMEWLVRGILELISRDSRLRGRKLFILPDGQPAKAEDVPNLTCISLPALLTGCLDYVILQPDLNTCGQRTLQEWIQEKEDIYAAGVLRETIGQSIRQPLTIETGLPEPAANVPEQLPAEPNLSAGSPDQSQKAGPSDRLSPDQSPPAGASGSFSGQPMAGTPVLPLSGQWPGHGTDLFAAAPAGQTYTGINIFSGAQVGQIQVFHMPPQGGNSLIELLSLDTGMYQLFVTEGGLCPGNSFSIAKSVALNRHIQEEIRAHFLDLGPVEQNEVTRLPAVFAAVNKDGRATDEYQQAILGRITGIRVQRHEIAFEWKPFCPFPQQILNRNESLFSIWHAPAANELSEEHWTIKRVPLIRTLQQAGFDPVRMVM